MAKRGVKRAVGGGRKRGLSWSEWCGKVKGRVIPGYDAEATKGPGDYFDAEAADRAILFAKRHVRFSKGKWTGQPFNPQPDQQATIGALFGWKREDGSRRYREVLIYKPRKNGKSEEAVVYILIAMFGDGESAGEVYNVANTSEDADLVYQRVKWNIETDPVLEARTTIYHSRVEMWVDDDNEDGTESQTLYKRLTSEKGSKHGKSASLVVYDELHMADDREMWDTLRTSMSARRQPLMIAITTADYDRPSLCNNRHDFACRVRDGLVEARHFLPVIWECPKGMDWRSEEAWRAANPNLGVTFPVDEIREACIEAQADPAQENAFKRLRLNMKTEQDKRWLPMEVWDRGAWMVPDGELVGKRCWGGLDMAKKVDMCALALFFPNVAKRPGPDGVERLVHACRLWFWCPEAQIEKRSRRDHVDYVLWRNLGLVKATPGDIMDEELIEADIRAAVAPFKVQAVGYDRGWGGVLGARLANQKPNLPMFEFGQYHTYYNEPMLKIEGMLLECSFAHGGHQVLRWNVGNVAVDTNAKGMIMPHKGKSIEKIDGFAALAMAVGCWCENEGGQVEVRSVYDGMADGEDML